MLTAEQQATFKADILANTDQSVIDAIANGDAGTIAAWYNVAADPAYYIWKHSVTRDEIMQNGFDWVRVDNLSVGKARIWEWMFDNGSQAVNPSKPNIRQGVIEVWKGTAADLLVRNSVWLHFQTLATRAEKLFATGTGTAADTNGNGPSTTELTASITFQDVSAALQS